MTDETNVVIFTNERKCIALYFLPNVKTYRSRSTTTSRWIGIRDRRRREEREREGNRRREFPGRRFTPVVERSHTERTRHPLGCSRSSTTFHPLAVRLLTPRFSLSFPPSLSSFFFSCRRLHSRKFSLLS